MDSSQTWVEALNISEENLQAWSNEAPEGKPLLVWALEQGKIPTEKYLAWASQNFGIPILQDIFFQSAFDVQFLTPHRATENWNAWSFPVGVWEDVTYVACVEPPIERAEGVCYLLAAPQILAEIWHSDAPPHKDELPDGMNITAAKPFKLNLDLDALGGTSETEAPPLPSIPEDEEPSAFATRPDAEVTQVPLSLVLNLPPTPAEPPVAPPVAPPVKAKSAEAPKKAESTKKAEKTKKVSPEDADKGIDLAFDRLQKTFEHVFLMKCGDVKAELYRAGSTITPKNKGKNASVELGFPTFFRIVARTLMPYHGYLVDSPAHREFFEALGFKDIPKCVCAVPIKVEGAMLGTLVAVGDETHQNPESLKLVETEAEALATKLIPTWSNAA